MYRMQLQSVSMLSDDLEAQQKLRSKMRTPDKRLKRSPGTALRSPSLTTARRCMVGVLNMNAVPCCICRFSIHLNVVDLGVFGYVQQCTRARSGTIFLMVFAVIISPLFHIDFVVSILAAPSLQTFKKRLKLFLFSRSFPS